eukprot:4912040-Pleurochrysis_carterae.AAC.3
MHAERKPPRIHSMRRRAFIASAGSQAEQARLHIDCSHTLLLSHLKLYMRANVGKHEDVHTGVHERM